MVKMKKKIFVAVLTAVVPSVVLARKNRFLRERPGAPV